jgi:hypothetical protein
MKKSAPWAAALATALISGLAAADVDEADFSLRATENLD